MSKTTERASFGSKLGVVLATAGSAVGLGNIWRFPGGPAEERGGWFLHHRLHRLRAHVGHTLHGERIHHRAAWGSQHGEGLRPHGWG